MIEIEISEPVFQFLGGIFHQDIEAPESALDEYLEKIPKEEQETDIAALKDFRMKKRMILSMKLLTEWTFLVTAYLKSYGSNKLFKKSKRILKLYNPL